MSRPNPDRPLVTAVQSEDAGAEELKPLVEKLGVITDRLEDVVKKLAMGSAIDPCAPSGSTAATDGNRAVDLRELHRLRGRSISWLRAQLRKPGDPLPHAQPGGPGHKITVTLSDYDAWIARQTAHTVNVKTLVTDVMTRVRRGQERP